TAPPVEVAPAEPPAETPAAEEEPARKSRSRSRGRTRGGRGSRAKGGAPDAAAAEAAAGEPAVEAIAGIERAREEASEVLPGPTPPAGRPGEAAAAGARPSSPAEAEFAAALERARTSAGRGVDRETLSQELAEFLAARPPEDDTGEPVPAQGRVDAWAAD